MTIRELAQVTGFSERTISQLENDKNQPLITTLKLVAEVLDVPVAYLGCYEGLPEETTGQRIRKARLYHGLNKKVFAEKLGVDVHTLIDWENGVHEPLSKYEGRLSSYNNIFNQLK